MLLDGRIAAGEWTGARELQLSPRLRVLVMRDAAYLYLAVVPQTPMMFGVDLFFDTGPDAPVLNLHGSAKLGERRLENDRWPDWSDVQSAAGTETAPSEGPERKGRRWIRLHLGGD